MHLVRQCRLLESYYGSNCTSGAIYSAEMTSRIAFDAHLKYAVEVATNPESIQLDRRCGMPHAQDRGPTGTTSVLAILRILYFRSISTNCYCPISLCGQSLGRTHAGANFLDINFGLYQLL